MASLTRGVFIVGAKRTPFGTFGGKLADKTCVDLQEVAAKAALQSANVAPELVDSVIIGNVLSSSSNDAPYISRHVLLRCGIPIPVPALTINRLCGSGFQSVVNGAHVSIKISFVSHTISETFYYLHCRILLWVILKLP